jgi:hypothetical protein
MANYDDFVSMGTTYEFSKGPKSIYYAKGDEDLFGVVLNVPQQDDDDEWGGTERIALERVSDEIGSLQEYILDPGGGGNGLWDRVAALETIVNVSTPYVDVGDVTISGSTNSITIGSSALLDGTQLQLGGSGAFLASQISANQYNISYKTEAIKMFDDGITPTVTISIGSTNYIFGASTFVVPGITISGDLGVSGDVNATNLTLTGDITGVKDIGTTGAYMETLYVDTVSSSTLCGTIVATGSISPLSSSPSGSYNIGAPALRFKAIAVEDLNCGDTATAKFTVDGTTGNIVTAGDLAINDISATTSTIGTLTAGTATICGDLIPGEITANLGAPALPGRWANIYGVDGNFSGNLSVLGDIRSVAFTSYTTTITGWTTATSTAYYKRVGKTVIVHFSITGTSNATSANFTLPVALDTTTAPTAYCVAIAVEDSGVPQTDPGSIILIPSTSSTVAYCGKNMSGPGNFTGSGSKTVTGTLIYEAA